MNPIDKLKNKIFGTPETSNIEHLVNFAREMHCVPEILGRDYEVYDVNGKLIYTIKQKPIKLNQLNLLLKALDSLHKKEEKETEKKIPKGRR